MAKLVWERPEKCPVVNGYVIRIMKESPVTRRTSTDLGSREGEKQRSDKGEETGE
jgi:hypothetical protein